MAATYTGSKTFSVTSTATQFLQPKVIKWLRVVNRGSDDIVIGFWANLTASPITDDPNNDITGSGAGIRVLAGESFTLDMTSNAILAAQGGLWMVSTANAVAVDVIALF